VTGTLPGWLTNWRAAPSRPGVCLLIALSPVLVVVLATLVPDPLLFSALVVAFGFLLVVVSVRQPDQAVLVLLFLLYARLPDTSALDTSRRWLSESGFVLLLGTILVRRLVARRERWTVDRTIVLLSLYAAAVALSGLNALNERAVLGALLACVREVALVFILSNLIVTGDQLRRASWALVASVALLALVGLFADLTGQDIGQLARIETNPVARTPGWPILGGPVGESNYFAQMLIVVLPLALYRAFAELRAVLRWAGLAAETGLLGVVTFGGSVALALAGAFWARSSLARAGRDSEALQLEAIILGPAGHLVTGLFLTLDVYQRWLWLLVALAIAGRQIALRAPRLARPTAVG
jgi:hypothetical protein